MTTAPGEENLRQGSELLPPFLVPSLGHSTRVLFQQQRHYTQGTRKLFTTVCTKPNRCILSTDSPTSDLHALPIKFILISFPNLGGPGSVVSIATGYGLDGRGIESRWEARFSAPVQTGPRAHPAPCTMGTGSFPGVKSGRDVTLTPHPLLVPLVMKE